MSRLRYILVRSVQTVFMIWLVMTFLWIFFRLMPGSYADLIAYQTSSEAAAEAFREKWGLNDPLYIQYLRFLRNMILLDPGTSLQYRTPVWDHVQMKIFNSFILVGPAMTASYIIGAGLGTVTGYSRDSLLEKYGIVPFLILGTFPSFFLAIISIIIFASWLNIFPTSGMLSPGVSSQYSDAAWWRMYVTKDLFIHYVLPFSVVALRYSYLPALIMRTNVVEVMDQGFTYYHRITGLPKFNQLKHITKHASLPVITLYPISMTRAISGLVLVEVVFNWPGIGNTLVGAVLSRDLPVIQFVFILVAIFVILSNFIIDLLYGVIDPRISISD